MAEGKPSLICDFMELYRYLIDDFVIQYCRKLGRKDFIVKSENFSTKRKGKREYLNDSQTRDFVRALHQYFQSKVSMPRVRMGEQQEIETLINEEALLFAQYLRSEKHDWIPRVVNLN
jgi:CRISPR/Cas system-associated endonuclease Cas1